MASVGIKIQQKKLSDGIARLNQGLAVSSLGGRVTGKVGNMGNLAAS